MVYLICIVFWIVATVRRTYYLRSQEIDLLLYSIDTSARTPRGPTGLSSGILMCSSEPRNSQPPWRFDEACRIERSEEYDWIILGDFYGRYASNVCPLGVKFLYLYTCTTIYNLLFNIKPIFTLDLPSQALDTVLRIILSKINLAVVTFIKVIASIYCYHASRSIGTVMNELVSVKVWYLILESSSSVSTQWLTLNRRDIKQSLHVCLGHNMSFAINAMNQTADVLISYDHDIQITRYSQRESSPEPGSTHSHGHSCSWLCHDIWALWVQRGMSGIAF